MSFDSLKKEMKDKSFSHKFHFFGEEAYLKNAYFNRLKEMLLENSPADFNLLTFEDEASVQDADVFVNTALIMGDKKVLVLKNTGLFKSSGANKDFWKGLFENVPDYLYIIAYDDSFDRRNALYKAFSADCQIVDFERRSRADLKGYTVRELSKNGKKIGTKALELFLDSVGNDLYNVTSELDKLMSLCRGRDSVSEQDVLEGVTKEFLTREYVLTDALLEKNSAKAVETLAGLLENRSDPVQILYIISSAYISTFKAKMMLDDKMQYADIVSAMKLPAPFLSKKYIGFAQKLSIDYLKKSIRLLKNADYDIKSGTQEPETCIKLLVCSLTE